MILQLLNIKIIFAGNQRQAKSMRLNALYIIVFIFISFYLYIKSSSTIHLVIH